MRKRPQYVPSSLCCRAPVFVDQKRAVRSLEAVRMPVPSGEISAWTTVLACPSRVRSWAPVSGDQRRAVPSHEAVTIRVVSGEKAACKTVSVCPSRVYSLAPVSVDQIRAVLAVEAVNYARAVGGKRRHAKCPRRVPPAYAAGPLFQRTRGARCRPMRQ